MLSRSVLEVGASIALGLAIILAGLRSGQPRRDLMLFVIPAAVWILVHFILMRPPTSSPLLNAIILFGPLVLAFLFLAKRWPTIGPTE